MPFLCVFPKANTDRKSAAARPDLARLATLLCPYAGEIRQMKLGGGTLFASSLVDLSVAERATAQSTLGRIPKNTKKGPQTAWLEISAKDDTLHFETDPLGTFPLWYFEDAERVVITGEVKALLALPSLVVDFAPNHASAGPKRPPHYSPYRNVRRVSPGAVLHVTPRLEVVEERRAPLTYRPESMFSTTEESAARLEDALLASARSIARNEGLLATFLSGGIDSSMTTSLLAQRGSVAETFTLGTKHGDEYADAEDLAAHLYLRSSRIFATGAQAVDHFERAVFCNETIDGLTAETLAQLSVLAAAAALTVRHVATGYGADLLFGSMLRHELYMKVTGVSDLQSLIERTCWSGEFAPFYAWSLGVEVHHLFWHPAVMNCAFRIPPAASFDGAREKLVLRNLACARGHLEERHAFRKKQALTDGTQFNRVLSSALGLGSPHAYAEKDAACVASLGRLYRA